VLLSHDRLALDPGEGGCVWGGSLSCSASHALKAAFGLTYGCIIAFAALIVWYSARTWHVLQKRLYQRHRPANLGLQYQVCILPILLMTLAMCW
jgi:hypothetical protein